LRGVLALSLHLRTTTGRLFIYYHFEEQPIQIIIIMIATATEFQSHPNIGAIYDDMVKEAVSPVSKHHPPRAHVKTFTVSTKTFDGADDDVPTTTRTATTSDEGIKKTFTIITKTFDGSTPPPPPKTEKRSFSRKNSTDSAFSVDKSSNSMPLRPVNRNFSRKNSTDSAFSIYNDDDMWSQRIGEIMNRGMGVAAAVVSPSQEEQSSPPIDTVRVSSSSSATASSSQPKIRRCQSTDCPSFTMLQSHQQGRENAWLKKQQFGGSLSRRNSMEGGGGGNTKALFARKNSRSTSPRFIPPIDSFGSDATNPVTAAAPTAASSTATTKPTGGFTRRNSMTRSRSPKFVEPLSTSDHDESRVFKGRMIRRHTLNEGPTTNPFTSRQLETLRESLRGTNDIAEQVKQRLLMEGRLDDDDIDEPSTPKADDKDDKQKNTVPKRPFSRHNSVEGVDPSIFPSLPMLDQSDNSHDHDDSDPNLDLALLFEHLVQEEEADDDASSDEEDDDDDEEEDNIIKRHMKSKIRRRCSTGGLRSFERENFRNFLEDTEGDDARPVQHVSGGGGDRRGSLFRKCSTGGLRTLQRENSRDLYSDDCSLDGKKGRVHLSNDTTFEAYLRKLTQEADVDTSNDANIINHHVGGAVRRRRSSIRSVSSHVDATEDPADFAQFISRIGQGVSSSLTTASTAANTSYSEESYGSPREIETVRSSFKKLPHSINLPSALDESVSSLENSNSYISTVKAPLKDSAEVNFRSSKSRSIRRLASNDGIEELQRLAKGTEPPATRRSSYSGIRTPDPEEIALEDLPGLIKNIDRDLVTERAVYQQRRSSGSEPAKGEAAQVDERSASVQFSLAGPRKPIEPPGTLASCVSDEDDVPKPRRQQQTHCIEDSVVSTEFHSKYIAKGYVEPQKGEIPPVPMIVVQEAEGASVAGIAKYQPKRRRSISDDRQRFDKQGKSFDERRRQGTGLK